MNMKRLMWGLVIIAALTLTACGGNGGVATTDPDPGPPPGPTLAEVRQAASEAAAAAMTAATGAADRVTGLMAKKDADLPNYTRASDAADDAQDAYMDAKAASDAAVAATTVEAAQAQKDIAETKKREAEDALGAVEMYASLVDTAQQAIDDEAQRVADVNAARAAAMQSYMDANDDATEAEAAATEAETDSPGSDFAMDARSAATAARAAANAAKAAHDAITNDMTKTEADAKAAEAATEAGKAETQYMIAKEKNGFVQASKATLAEQQRQRDVADAKAAAAAAVQAAETAKNNAAAAATAAETARDNAMNEYNRAMAARTDHMKAKEEYDKARAAATDARTAATNAENAYTAAMQAHAGIMDAGTASDAQAAQRTAETEKGNAETAEGTADDKKMEAETAQTMAMKYANTHVLGLLKAANAMGVMDDPTTTTVDEKAAAITAVATEIGKAAGVPDTDADNDSVTDTGSGKATVTAMWPADTPDNPATADMDESAMGKLAITVTGGDAMALHFQETAAETDDTNTDVNETIKTATRIDGLPGFMTGYSISDRGSHALVFTDKQQGTPAVEAVTAVTEKELINVDATVGTVTDKGTMSGSEIGSYTGVTYFEGSDTDDAGQAFTGTLTCGDSCSIEPVEDSEGNVTYTLTGDYKFSGSRAARAAVTAAAAAENEDYLAFGVWLKEDGDDSMNGNQPQFAAFAGGGTEFSVTANLAGTATYTGAATGVYTEGTRVDYFQGDAMLEADFGDTTGVGTIKGMINNIVAGGTDMSDVINLDSADLTAKGSSFAGAATMGASTVTGGAATYTYNGHWGGNFYGPAAEKDATGDDLLPPAVAGTFGVTGTMGTGENAVTKSYVGAFGARR